MVDQFVDLLDLEPVTGNLTQLGNHSAIPVVNWTVSALEQCPEADRVDGDERTCQSNSHHNSIASSSHLSF